MTSNSLDTSFAEQKFYILVQSSLHACSVTVVSDSLWLCGLTADYSLTTVDCSAPGFSVHGVLQAAIWSGLPFLPPGDLRYPGIETKSPASPALAGEFFTTKQSGKPACLSFILHVGLWPILSIFCKRSAKGHRRFVFRFILLHVDIQLIQHHLLKTLSAPLYCLCSFVKDQFTVLLKSWLIIFWLCWVLCCTKAFSLRWAGTIFHCGAQACRLLVAVACLVAEQGL